MNELIKQDLYEKLQFKIPERFTLGEYVQLLVFDYEDIAQLFEMDRVDYQYTKYPLLPAVEDFFDENNGESHVSDLFNMMVKKEVFGDEDAIVEELIDDHNSEIYINTWERLWDEWGGAFITDIMLVATHLHLSFCINNSKDKYLNLPSLSVW